MKTYRLSAPDGSIYESPNPGQLGGYKPQRIYGRLDCRSALSHLQKGNYAAHRVFLLMKALQSQLDSALAPSAYPSSMQNGKQVASVGQKTIRG